MGQALLPVGSQMSAMLHQGINVAGQGQGGHIGIDAVNDGARLLARATVRLLDRDHLPGFVFPVLGKYLVVVRIQLAGGVVGDVQQGHGLRCWRRLLGPNCWGAER